MSDYRFVYRGGVGEIVEKKSRFIASVAPAASEDEALAFIEQTKKKYWDARHNCTAFTVGDRHQLTRCSDDSEPSGTAGRPMLDVLLGEDIHDAVVVVTRYFGGVLLGTGGLVRAYSSAVREGLNASVILDRHDGVRLTIRTDYACLGRLQYLLSSRGIPILSSDYTEQVILDVLCPIGSLSSVVSEISDGTDGRALTSSGESCIYTVVNGEPIILE